MRTAVAVVDDKGNELDSGCRCDGWCWSGKQVEHKRWIIGGLEHQPTHSRRPKVKCRVRHKTDIIKVNHLENFVFQHEIN